MRRNGGANWDADYTAMARAFLELVASGTSLPRAQLARCKDAVNEVVRRNASETAVLAEAAVAWVMLNPQPVLLGEARYSR